MIIGNGLIASQFYDFRLSADVLIFASGVSNSANTESADFDRETNFLLEAIGKYPQRKLVYFSTCSVYDPSLQQSSYVQHKLRLEATIQQQVDKYLIFRLSNPIGKNNNPHTFFNFFVNSILTGHPFNVWAYAERNIIDVDDFYKLARYMIGHEKFDNQIINLANLKNYKVLEIVETMENHFGKKGNYTVLPKGNALEIDTGLVATLSHKLQIDFAPDYIIRLLKKYFPF